MRSPSRRASLLVALTMLACPLLRAWAPAAATKSAPRSVAGRSVCARPLRVTRLALRGGASEEEEEEGEEDLDSEAIRDKYADEPPPDHIRYTGGVRPMPKAQTQGDEQANATADTTAALIAADAAVEDIEEEVDAAKEIQRQMRQGEQPDSSSGSEPLWVPGQIRQGGKKLRYTDGVADYFRDVLNRSNPLDQFEPNASMGHTYSDMDFALKAWESYRPSEQNGQWSDFLESLRASGVAVAARPTHNFSMGPLPNYIQREYGDDSYVGPWRERQCFEKDHVANTVNNTFSFMIPEPNYQQQLRTNKTHFLRGHEVSVPFVAPGSMPDAAAHEGLSAVLDALDDMERWKAGELPMALNEEDRAELERDKARKIDEQVIEAARTGSLGLLQRLVAMGGNLTAEDDDDLLQPIHHAAIHGHKDVVTYLLDHGVDVNVTDGYGRTALHWSAYNGHTDVAQVLLDKGVDVCAKTPGGCTAYAFSAMFMHGENDIINFFRTEEAKFNKDLRGRSKFVVMTGNNSTRESAEKARLQHPLASAYD